MTVNPRSIGVLWFTVATLVAAGAPAEAASLLYDNNLITIGDLHTTSHVQGRTIVGGNLYNTNSPVFAQSLGSVPPTDRTLIVGGDIYGHFHLENGTLEYGGTLDPVNLQNDNGHLVVFNAKTIPVHIPAFSISSIENALRARSVSYAAMDANSAIQIVEGKKVVFNATPDADGVATFSISTDLFALANLEFDLNLNGAESVVINVAGESVNQMGNFLGNFANAAAASRVLWNFHEATSLSFNRAFWGSILAVDAVLWNNNQNIDGGVFVDTFHMTGEVHLAPYDEPRLVPTPTGGMAAAVLVGGLALRPRRRPAHACV